MYHGIYDVSLIFETGGKILRVLWKVNGARGKEEKLHVRCIPFQPRSSPGRRGRLRSLNTALLSLLTRPRIHRRSATFAKRFAKLDREEIVEDIEIMYPIDELSSRCLRKLTLKLARAEGNSPCSMGTTTNSSNGPRNPVKDTLLPDQTQIVRNNTIPSAERRPVNSCFLYLEYSFSPN